MYIMGARVLPRALLGHAGSGLPTFGLACIRADQSECQSTVAEGAFLSTAGPTSRTCSRKEGRHVPNKVGVKSARWAR